MIAFQETLIKFKVVSFSFLFFFFFEYLISIQLNHHSFVIPGTLKMHEMINLDGEPTETLHFNAINVRNHGNMLVRNGKNRRTLSGSYIQVSSYPLESKKAVFTNKNTIHYVQLGE